MTTKPDWRKGLMRLWVAISTIWIFAIGVWVRIDKSSADFFRYSATPKRSPDWNDAQWEAIQSVNQRMLSAATDILTSKLLVMFVPSIFLLFIIILGQWVAHGFWGGK